MASRDYWKVQLSSWDEALSDLRRATTAFPRDADEFARTAQSFFYFSNAGHIGEAATQRHATLIVNSFNLWGADYRAALDSCATRLRDDLGRFATLEARILSATRSLSTSSDIRNDEINQIGRSSLDITRCSEVKPVARDYLPARTGPAETLGPFGAAAAWLLRTESPELALIIGLLGFGFFGALATGFVREFAGTPGNDMPSMGFIVPALIRGIGAAILVFLLAKGGTAIFTRGEAMPNAYAIFCFVAAVFSEDVWAWARNRQRKQLPADDTGVKPRSAEPARSPDARPPEPSRSTWDG